MVHWAKLEQTKRGLCMGVRKNIQDKRYQLLRGQMEQLEVSKLYICCAYVNQRQIA